MALSLLTLLYGVMLSELVFRPAAADFLVRAGVTRDLGGSRGFHRIMGIVGILTVVLLTFFVLLVSMANFD